MSIDFTGCPLMATIMSPDFMPTLSAGPPGMTLVIYAPEVTGRLYWVAMSWLTVWP